MYSPSTSFFNRFGGRSPRLEFPLDDIFALAHPCRISPGFLDGTQNFSSLTQVLLRALPSKEEKGPGIHRMRMCQIKTHKNNEYTQTKRCGASGVWS